MKALGLYTHTHTHTHTHTDSLKENKKENIKGITLVALVITIVILLILAGISISALTQIGLFGKAKQAEQVSKEKQEEENEILETYENEVDKYLGESNKVFIGNTVKEAILYGDMLKADDNIELKDEKENKIVVPAGFKVTSDATTVDKGIVVEDATGTATNGSQFVWVPVGTITKEDGSTTTINLDRYTFDSSGKETPQGDKVISTNTYYQELETSDKGNAVAKNITDFKNSVATNGGYYIGRYEARKNVEGTITEVKTDTVWNKITQSDAADKAQKMYDNTNPFTSDLMNSYAWDTATLFAQSCGTNKKYSRQNSLNTGSLATTGTTNDIQCNIYDMASNMIEWTTETCNRSGKSCVSRGGRYDGSSNYVSIRIDVITSGSASDIGFRPILFL